MGSQGIRRGRVPLVVLGVLVVLGSLTFRSTALASHQFPDVHNDHLFHDEISWAADMGITTGFTDGTFRPTAAVTRQATVAFLHRLWRALGQDSGALPDPGFSDVNPANLAYQDIAWAADLGITTGFADGTFRPTDPVTRQAVVIFLHRLWVALGEDSGDPPDPGFSDVNPIDLAYPDIAWAADLGITTGFADGTFRPTDPVTRQAVVAFVRRLFVLVAIEVNTTADTVDVAPGDGICADANDECSLRSAIMEANAKAGPDLIVVAPGLELIELQLAGTHEDESSTGDLDVTDDLVIVGSGVTVDAAGLDRVLHLHGHNVALIDIALTGGSTTAGGGGINYYGSGTLTIANSTISNNTASQSGGIRNYGGTVTITNSTISNNTAGQGGGVRNNGSGAIAITNSTISNNTAGYGGGINNSFGNNTITITNSTIANNTASNGSGGIDNSGDLTISGSTVSNNTALTGSGGGIHHDSGTLAITSSTIAGNDAPTGAALVRLTGVAMVQGSIIASAGEDCVGSIISGGFNMGSDASCGLTQPNDQPSTDALLGPVADNGGDTHTNLPSDASPALNAIPIGTAILCDGTITTDQRGEPRPAGVACDIGSVERQATDP